MELEGASSSKAESPDPVEAALKGLTFGTEAVIGHFGGITTETGRITWWSVYSGDDTVDRLLANPVYRVAQILSVLGSEVRLSILRCLLPASKTAAEIVSELGLGTTGQAYHHLRELERAGYVLQKSGKWHFDMRRGRVYLTALALAADAGAEEPDDNEKQAE